MRFWVACLNIKSSVSDSQPHYSVVSLYHGTAGAVQPAKATLQLYRKRPHGERNPRPHDDFALILNDLAASFEGRNEYISRLCRYPLLILDDFGMERGTEYGLEQVFQCD